MLKQTTLLSTLQRVLLLRRVLGIVWTAAPLLTITRIILLVIQGTLPIAALYLTKLILDSIVTTSQSSAPSSYAALGLVVTLAGLTLAGFLSASLNTVVTEAHEQAVTDYTLSLIHTKSTVVDLAHFENSHYQDLLHRAQRDANYLPTYIVNSLGRICQSGITFALLVGLLFSQNWLIAGLFMLAALPGTFVRLRYSQRLYELNRRQTPLERQWWYFHWLLTGEAHAKELRLFDLGTVLLQRVRKIRHALSSERLRHARERASAELLAELPGGIAIFGGFAYLVGETVHGALTIGDLVICYQAYQKGHASLREVLSGLVRLYQDTLFLEDLFELLDLAPRVFDVASPLPVPRQMNRGLVFDHVNFSYDGSDQPVLQDINLTIRPGEHIALVGENGTGKTTLVKLLCRLYDPTGGRITLDGIDIRELSLVGLRRQITVVFQDHARYNLSARENIWLGNVLLRPEDKRIPEAAAATGADVVINKLRHGYDTRLGKWFDDDQELSIGEWQKIAIARALVRDAPIIVLDEPTSALDVASEHSLFQNFKRLSEDRTTILISHRLSAVRMADTIYLLVNGRIAEVGSHDDLMRRGGEYARTFELQASNYQ